MAAIRDPAFWHRFSIAVHNDEAHSSNNTRPELKHSDSWLERQQQKRSRRTCICWIFWFCFLVFVAALVITIIWLKTSGKLDHLKSPLAPRSGSNTM
ncbi:hypothetical protein P152DRAFT_470690 [Eremomyces bilateralis CBS 781.70]|uniref:Uncharacterized protein n=1 Tax=Eremomyces bilateralis CBS 781.70 TaxID=1392243 RepID=A0A6G1GFC8_9PEZI|nr:uncharacterized protein P152DRAFT_470690 [Eremomyces bilateralis CBS 781.70]KAF1816702.1 hypothetical protein P152DRAFT_470690 [Eremomyces bilateralis CBS 781.70]